MRHCLCCGGQQCVAAGSYTATRRRRDSDVEPRARTLADSYGQPHETYVCPGIKSTRAKLEASVLELRAAEVGEADLEECQLGQRR